MAVRGAIVRKFSAKDVHYMLVVPGVEDFRLKHQIHTTLLQLSGNATLKGSHQSIQSRPMRIRFIGNQVPHDWTEAHAEHNEMILALEARDGDRLALAVMRHMAMTFERVRRTL